MIGLVALSDSNSKHLLLPSIGMSVFNGGKESLHTSGQCSYDHNYVFNISFIT